MASPRAPKTIYIVSDSTGELAIRYANALLTQFPGENIVAKRFNFVEDAAELQKIFQRMSNRHSVLFHTVLSRDLKKKIDDWSRVHKIPACDLTGPPTDFMIRYLKAKPVWNVKTLHRINRDYNERINAIEYTIQHDDGMGVPTWGRADVILVGPSRTSKTPTSIYLATKGYCVANMPIALQVGLREELESRKGDPRVVAFHIQPEKLQEVRVKRAAELGTIPAGYTDEDEIEKELKWVDRVYKKMDWKVIDVTDRAIEETAAMIMRMVEKNA